MFKRVTTALRSLDVQKDSAFTMTADNMSIIPQAVELRGIKISTASRKSSMPDSRSSTADARSSKKKMSSLVNMTRNVGTTMMELVAEKCLPI